MVESSFAGRKNNSRRYPGAKSPRPDNYKFRKDEAKERQEAYDKLTTSSKLENIDKMFGVGIGAKKQRAKLAKKLEEEKVIKTSSTKKAKV